MSLNRRPTGASSYTSPGPAPLAFSNSHPEQLNARQLRERSERFYKEFATTLGDELAAGFRILRALLSDSCKSFAQYFSSRETLNSYGPIKAATDLLTLDEMQEKFINQEYRELYEFVRDFNRLVNLMREEFPPNHFIMKRIQKMETVFNQKLNLLPGSILFNLTYQLQQQAESNARPERSSSASSNPKFYGMEQGILVPRGLTHRPRVDDSLGGHFGSSASSSLAPAGSVSPTDVLLDSAVLPPPTTSSLSSRTRSAISALDRRREYDEMARTIDSWEVERFGDQLPLVTHMPELVEVAVFLHATSGLYNWPRSFTLCELERAVLMPAASNVAHHVLSALLKQRRGFPTREKEAIEAIKAQNASMPRILLEYSVIEFRLTSLLQYWYRHAAVYFKGNFANAALHLGLDYQFFQVLGFECPFNDTMHFHDLTLYQRVWVLKAICDWLLVHNENVRSVFEQSDSQVLRETLLGYDRHRSAYIYFPQLCYAPKRGADTNTSSSSGARGRGSAAEDETEQQLVEFRVYRVPVFDNETLLVDTAPTASPFGAASLFGGASSLLGNGKRDSDDDESEPANSRSATPSANGELLQNSGRSTAFDALSSPFSIASRFGAGSRNARSNRSSRGKFGRSRRGAKGRGRGARGRNSKVAAATAAANASVADTTLDSSVADPSEAAPTPEGEQADFGALDLDSEEEDAEQSNTIVNAHQPECATIDGLEDEREGNGASSVEPNLTPNGGTTSDGPSSAKRASHKRKLSTDSAATESSTPSASASAPRKSTSDAGGPPSSKRPRPSPLAITTPIPTFSTARTLDVDESSQQSSEVPPPSATEEVPIDPVPYSNGGEIELSSDTSKPTNRDQTGDKEVNKDSEPAAKPKPEPTIKLPDLNKFVLVAWDLESLQKLISKLEEATMESLEEQQKTVEAQLERVRSEFERANNKNKSSAANNNISVSAKTGEQQPIPEPTKEASANSKQSSSDPRQPSASDATALRAGLESEPITNNSKPSSDIQEPINESTRETARESETLENEQLLSLAAELGCRNPPRQCKTRASTTAHASPATPVRASSRRSRPSVRASSPSAQSAVDDSSRDLSPETSSLSSKKSSNSKRSKSSSNKRRSDSSSPKKDKRSSRSHSKKGNKTKREKKDPVDAFFESEERRLATTLKTLVPYLERESTAEETEESVMRTWEGHAAQEQRRLRARRDYDCWMDAIAYEERRKLDVEARKKKLEELRQQHEQIMILERQQREMKKKAQQEKLTAISTTKSPSIGSPSVGSVILPASLIPKRAAEHQSPPRASPAVSSVGTNFPTQMAANRNVQQPPLQFLVGSSATNVRPSLVPPSASSALSAQQAQVASASLPQMQPQQANNANGLSAQYTVSSLQSPVDTLALQLAKSATSFASVVVGHLPTLIGTSTILSGRLPTLQTLQQARLASGAQNNTSAAPSTLPTPVAMPRPPPAPQAAAGPLLLTPSIQIQSSAPRPNNSNSIVVLAGSPVKRLGSPNQIRPAALPADPMRVVKPVQALENVLQNQPGVVTVGGAVRSVSPGGRSVASAPQSLPVTSNTIASPIRFSATRPAAMVPLQMPNSAPAGAGPRYVAVPLRLANANPAQATATNQTTQASQASSAGSGIQHTSAILLANPPPNYTQQILTQASQLATQAQQLANYFVVPMNNQPQAQPVQTIPLSRNPDGSTYISQESIMQLTSRALSNQVPPLVTIRIPYQPASQSSSTNMIVPSEKPQVFIYNPSPANQVAPVSVASMPKSDPNTVRPNNSTLGAASAVPTAPAASGPSASASLPNAVGIVSKATTSGTPLASLPLISNAGSISQLHVYNVRDRLWTADGRAVRMAAGKLEFLDERAPPETLAELHKHIAQKQSVEKNN